MSAYMHQCRLRIVQINLDCFDTPFAAIFVRARPLSTLNLFDKLGCGVHFHSCDVYIAIIAKPSPYIGASVVSKAHQHFVGSHCALSKTLAYGFGNFRFSQVFPADAVSRLGRITRIKSRARCIKMLKIFVCKHLLLWRQRHNCPLINHHGCTAEP